MFHYMFYLQKMDSKLSFSAEENSFDLYDKIFIVVQAFDNLIDNILKLGHKIAELLTVANTYLLTLKKPFKNQDTQNNEASILRDTIENPSVNGLHDIAGLHYIKDVLYTLVILPKSQPQLFHNRPANKTVLLYGPPGTGKTRLVHGLAAEAGAVLHAISVGNLLSSFVGETERNIKNIFNCLRTTESFSILFIDELDGLCRKRASSENEHTRRIKTELMCQMTKMTNCHNTIIIAATNCPWDLDSAILRRFQKRLYVPLPDSKERLELFQLLTKDTPIIQTPEQLIELIQATEGYSGSDIDTLVHDALDIPLIELQSTKIWNNTVDGFFEPIVDDNSPVQNIENIVLDTFRNLPQCKIRARPVKVNDFLKAAKHLQVTVTSEMLDQYEAFKCSK